MKIALPNFLIHRLLALLLSCSALSAAAGITDSIITPHKGMVVIEAEHYHAQHNAGIRRWITFNARSNKNHGLPDNDKTHLNGASNDAYIELLPDTRTNHNEPLIHEENYSATPGSTAVLTYPINFDTPGRYYIWARVFSSGSEDNGVHFGLNARWPLSSQRLQLCTGKNRWTWSSNQRVPSNHCGTPNTIWVDVPSQGVNNLTLSMREDGFELDKIILTRDANFKPDGMGPKETRVYPSTLDRKKKYFAIEEYSLILNAQDTFESTGKIPFYYDGKNDALGIDARKKPYRDVWVTSKLVVPESLWGKKAIESRTFKNAILVTLGEIDGESSYRVMLNDTLVAEVINQETSTDYQENYFHLGSLTLKPKDVITVQSKAVTNGKISEKGGTAYARGRWRGIVLQQ
jgi:hypothetical protein